tara:strand:- start:198 stop:392 length:195 start_codon:yes stop_codon:yes gene_type:complete
MTIITKIKDLPIKDRYKISKSPKAFIIIDQDNNYILTDDLNRYKNIYIKDGGCFGCLETIKTEL